MKSLMAVVLILNVFSNNSFGKEKVLTIEENPYCDFYQIIESGKGEEYKHIVGIVIREEKDSLIIKPIHEKDISKIILKTQNKSKYKNVEEIEFFIINDKACLRKVRERD